MRYGEDIDIPSLAGDYANFWIEKNGVGMGDLEIQTLIQKTGSTIFQSGFEKSWLKNHKNYERKTHRTPQRNARKGTGRSHTADGAKKLRCKNIHRNLILYLDPINPP